MPKKKMHPSLTAALPTSLMSPTAKQRQWGDNLFDLDCDPQGALDRYQASVRTAREVRSKRAACDPGEAVPSTPAPLRAWLRAQRTRERAHTLAALRADARYASLAPFVTSD